MDIKNPWISRDVFEMEIDKIRARRGTPETGEEIKGNLVGLALSGGGIRSATFGLGVFEAMKSLGLLKKVDYLSTVSGGGYIGAWLSANCKRAAERAAAPGKAPANADDRKAYETASEDWLDEKADWRESIAHLRRYSNYLSPKVGFFSADTWAMATVWLRNTLLVQLNVILAIAVALLVPRLLFPVFQWWPQAGDVAPGLDWRWTTVVLFILAVVGIAGNQLRLNRNGNVPFLRARRWAAGLAAATILLGAAWWLGRYFDFHPFADGQIDWVPAALIALCLVLAGFCLLPAAVKFIAMTWPGNDPPTQINYTQGWVQAVVVIPLMATGLLLAAVLWAKTTDVSPPGGYGGLGGQNSFGWLFMNAWQYWPFPLSVAFASLWLLSFFSIRDWWDTKGFLIACVAPVPAVLVLHALLCVIMLLLNRWYQSGIAEGQWLAFIWAPAMLLFAFSLAVVMLIGIMGRQSTEAVREWWSRLGAWMDIYGVAWLLLAVAAIYGPQWAAFVLDSGSWQGSSAVGVWLATTLAGLLAGKSGATGGVQKSARSEKTTAEKLLNLVAVIGPFFFIAGLLIGISTCLHLIVLSLSGQTWADFCVLHVEHWKYLYDSCVMDVLSVLAAAFVSLLVLSARVDINEFSLNAFYRSRLSRCYLGAARFLPGERNPQNFTEFDDKDDLLMADLQGIDGKLSGPLHIVNCALNLGGSSDLALHTRHSAAFTLTPYTAGSGYLSRDASGAKKPLGYQPIAGYGGRDGQPTLAQAISVSGAAASPNMGYHTSPVVAFLLTVFNVRLGWWFPNPKEGGGKSPSPWFSLRYLFKELFGGADDKTDYLMISDGGHFENLAAYELIRRRCHVVIISDAECDRELKFEGLGTLIRMCEVDFGTCITLDVGDIRLDTETNWSGCRYAVGQIHYGDGIPDGILIYLKASMTGHEDTSVLQYKASHPDFPHESTGDQFYGEDQFESYRHLGREIAKSTFGPPHPARRSG